jgi:hypothetical protein
MKYIIIPKYLASKSIQHIVEKKDSDQAKALGRKDARSFQSGKFCNVNYCEDNHVDTVERQTFHFLFF